MTTRRLVVYGSCVSRDTFEVGLRPTMQLVRYVARQSLISAYGPPALSLEIPEGVLDHEFQRRVLREDLASSLPEALTLAATRPLVVLWDLVDERLGVYRLEDGSTVTRSLELIRSGLDTELAQRAEHLSFGSAAHVAAWANALERLCTQVRASPSPVHVIALDAPWAVCDESGRPAPTSFGTTPAEANRHRLPYADLLRGQDEIDLIPVPVAEVRSDSAHQWGPAPFHYSRRTYEVIADLVMQRIAARRVTG